MQENLFKVKEYVYDANNMTHQFTETELPKYVIKLRITFIMTVINV